MKIYISEEHGSIYHLFGDELAFTPMSSYSDMYELDGDKPFKECFLHGETGFVEWENIDEDLVEPLREIEKKLKQCDHDQTYYSKTGKCGKCKEQNVFANLDFIDKCEGCGEDLVEGQAVIYGEKRHSACS